MGRLADSGSDEYALMRVRELQSRGPEVLFSTSLHWVYPHFFQTQLPQQVSRYHLN